MRPHESFWSYRSHRWLKLALILVAGSTAVYVVSQPERGHHGGTWLGYALGTVALGLMLWLGWFGVRKRSYRAPGAPLRGWLSAHVYLGLALLVLVPLHSGFQFGANLHGLAFLLVIATVTSGLFGVVMYAAVPERMTENRPGEKLAQLFERIDDVDAECASLACAMPDGVARAVARSVSDTRVGGSLRQQLLASQRGCATALAIRTIASEQASLVGRARDELRKLLELLDLKRSLLERIRRDLRLRRLLDAWLVAHVPLAVASLAAVAAHVFVVLYYR